jgi:hypothetical protein
MKYPDEMRGSEGERCLVADLRTGTIHEGTVQRWDDATKKADVLYANGTLVRVGYSFVLLEGEES